MLLAVPNFSEGRRREIIGALAAALAGGEGVRLLDTHSDPDHDRSVFSLAGEAKALVDAVVAGALLACELIELRAAGEAGVHPHIGVLDVAPLVYPQPSARGLACAAALVLADRLGEEAGLPAFLYGELAGGRSRAELRSGGATGLRERVARAELAPDFGPPQIDSRRGAVLVGARPPLVAFNIELAAEVSLEQARALARSLREGGERGLPGVRALALRLPGRGLIQLSFNIEDPVGVPLLRVLEAVREQAQVARCELVGLAPQGALSGFPLELLSPPFDAARQVLESALASARQAP